MPKKMCISIFDENVMGCNCRFSLAIMSNIHELQTFGNAIIFYENIDSKNKYKKTFELDWAMFKGEKPTSDQLDQFYL